MSQECSDQSSENYYCDPTRPVPGTIAGSVMWFNGKLARRLLLHMQVHPLVAADEQFMQHSEQESWLFRVAC